MRGPTGVKFCTVVSTRLEWLERSKVTNVHRVEIERRIGCDITQTVYRRRWRCVAIIAVSNSHIHQMSPRQSLSFGVIQS